MIRKWVWVTYVCTNNWMLMVAKAWPITYIISCNHPQTQGGPNLAWFQLYSEDGSSNTGIYSAT